MADQVSVGGVKIECNTVRNADGSYESNITFGINVHPEEYPLAGRKVVGALFTHFAECKSMSEAFAKLFELGVKPANDNASTHTHDAGAPAEAKPTSPTMVEGVLLLDDEDDGAGGGMTY